MRDAFTKATKKLNFLKINKSIKNFFQEVENYAINKLRLTPWNVIDFDYFPVPGNLDDDRNNNERAILSQIILLF